MTDDNDGEIWIVFGGEDDEGYGAEPHAERREGNPTDQANQPE